MTESSPTPHPSFSSLSSSSNPNAKYNPITTSSGWFPAPQPSLTIDTLSSWITVSGACFVSSWYFLITQSFGANSILTSIAVCSFLLALLSFLGLSTRLSSEFYREHYGYNIPLGKRNIVYYSPFQLGILCFYFGTFLMIGIAAWSLMESNRILGSLTILGLGIIVIVTGFTVFWYMIKHPIGIATDHLYTHQHTGYGGGRGKYGNNTDGNSNGYLNYPHIVTLSNHLPMNDPINGDTNNTDRATNGANQNMSSESSNPTRSNTTMTANTSTTTTHHLVLSGWIRKPSAVPFPVMESVRITNSLSPSSVMQSVNNEEKNQ